MSSLAQKDGRNTRYFEIQNDGVFVRTKFAKELNEYKIHFTDIHDDESVFRKSKDPVLIAIVISVLLNSILLTIFIGESYQLSESSGMIVFGIAMIPSLIVTAICNNEFRAESSKNLAAAKPLIFSYRKKEMEEVDGFIAEIKKSKKEYYLREYYKVDNLIPTHTQIARIHWLYENKYITESDAQFIIDELESRRIINGL
ncbi:exosortase/archaeosortase family protein [Chryseobacterium antibioticum]|uniref:Exosortase/archaeosortase family protein n=1 Tax=Chryseobacterium pyrolae TaxID=2987481 RepID=A0ABT2IM42_9FLAO|nr:exosortase/archaeosortase family protein [Chryseobacterium pyrolae]MCT2409649.1 exosortase/archaeosortase family protein [Chryseobacterium pyrolae]